MKKVCSKRTLAKTILWRLIASSTTFAIAYIVEGTFEKAGTIVALDTAIKTAFYFIHEKSWEANKCLKNEDVVDDKNKKDQQQDVEINNVSVVVE
jgi:uncharacterized membrane protein